MPPHGARRKVQSGEFPRGMRLSIGSCELDYGGAIPAAWRKGIAETNQLSIQVEPDVSARLPAVGGREGKIGQFHDGLVNGFPIAPTKTCRQPTPNTSAPSVTAASARL